MTFAVATAIEPAGTDHWQSEIQPGWDIAGNPNGGYLLAIAGRAMAAAAERPDVATITAHYLRPGQPGPVSIDTEVLKSGSRFATVRGTLRANESMISSIGSFTDQAAWDDDRTIELVDAPDWGDPLEQPRVPAGEGFPPPIMGRVDLRIHPEDSFFINGPSGTPTMRGWVRLEDNEPWDTLGLLLASDVFPPTIFNTDLRVAWAPTVELTVHVRRRPAPGWLRCEFTSRFITGGFVEEDGLMWDSTGALVAQSRQLALLPRPE